MDKTPLRKIEYKDWVIYNDREYVRSEVRSVNHYRQGSKTTYSDYHTIKWSEYGVDGNVQYFSSDMGWMGEDNVLHKDNPVPEIELEFKKTIGKDLYYIK